MANPNIRTGLQIPSFTYPGVVCNMPDAFDLEAVEFAGSALSKVFAR